MIYIFRSLIAFKWLLRAIEHHGSSVIYGINFIVNGFSGDQDEENFIAFVEDSKLANVYLNHSTKLLPEVGLKMLFRFHHEKFCVLKLIEQKRIIKSAIYSFADFGRYSGD